MNSGVPDHQLSKVPVSERNNNHGIKFDHENMRVLADNTEGNADPEVARLLSSVADQMRDQGVTGELDPEAENTFLFPSNERGNTTHYKVR